LAVACPARADDLAALPIKALIERNPSVDWNAVDEVFLGCANQAGEDNRNVARMALLLAGLPESIPGVTLNRLCASGMDAIGTAFAPSPAAKWSWRLPAASSRCPARRS
jgi:3-oxoadipyl-CoA thiolase